VNNGGIVKGKKHILQGGKYGTLSEENPVKTCLTCNDEISKEKTEKKSVEKQCESH
jgi:hypothetical protein